MATVRIAVTGLLAAALAVAVGSAQQPGIAPQGAPFGGGGFGGAGSEYSLMPVPRGAAHDAISDLAKQFVKSTKDDEKKELRKKLSDAIGKQFDQMAEQQQKELDDLEKQVSALRTLLKKRHDARD